jgi:hypothetical protein
MTRTLSRLRRGVLAATVATVLGASLAIVGSAPSYGAYDTVTVSDPKDDLFRGPDPDGYQFPDVVSLSYQHVGTGKAATLRVVIQFRKDAPWRRLDEVQLDANKYRAHVRFNDAYTAHYVYIEKPGAVLAKKCKVCTVHQVFKKRRLVFSMPYSKIGKPSNISFGVLYAAQGAIQDRVARPSSLLY